MTDEGRRLGGLGERTERERRDDAACAICAFSERGGHEIVVRRGILPAHEFTAADRNEAL